MILFMSPSASPVSVDNSVCVNIVLGYEHYLCLLLCKTMLYISCSTCLQGGFTPILEAIFCGHTNVATYLISLPGVNLDVSDKVTVCHEDFL